MYDKWLSSYSKSPLFRNIKDRDLVVMLECLRPKLVEYKKDKYIAVEGDEYDGIGILLSGEAVVSKENAAGNRVIINILKPGDMFGEMAAFSNKDKWPATIYSQEKCAVSFLPPSKIIGECEKTCYSHRTLILNMLGIISEKALMLNRKVEYLAIKSMRAKISTFLLEQYKKTGKTTFMIPLNRNELADFLNVSRPSMSREMCRMKEEGIIDFHRASIRIINPEALKKSVE